MSRRYILIGGLSLSLLTVIAIGLFRLIAVETERIETQRKIHFEHRVSEIRADTEKRIRMLRENWQRDRQQALDEGLKLAGSFGNAKDCANQIAQWIKNVDRNYQVAEANLTTEETQKIAELRNQIWGK